VSSRPSERARRVHGSPLGRLQAVSSAAGLVGLGFLDGPHPDAPDDAVDADPHRLGPALAAYLSGEFGALGGVPVDLEGTDFQRRVWRLLTTLAPGETTTYGAIAVELGLGRGGARAVGTAVGANPVALVVPCHRVLGVGGALTGFAWGLDRKRWLLRHEGVPLGPEQVTMFG
jgi:methylated-DNA-[protein]-cysteine S-methyltransferase